MNKMMKRKTNKTALRVMIFVGVLSVLLTLFNTIASAQQSLSLQIEPVDFSDYPDLQFVGTPSNEFGVPILGLTASDFSVRDPVGPLDFTVREIVDDDQPISIILALDVSGSIVLAEQLEAVRNAARSLAPGQGILGTQDQLGVLFFNVAQDGSRVILFPEEDPREIQPTLDGGAIINFVNSFQTTDNQAGTPLYDAIYRSIQVGSVNMNPARRAVIVMTDGVDVDRNGNPPGSIHADLELVIAEAVKEKIPVFTVGLGNDIDAIDLRRIASSTGGTARIEISEEELTESFADVVERLKTKYVFTATARVRPDGQQHNLTVGVQSGALSTERTAGFTALYPDAPIIQMTYLNNQGQELASELLESGVAGTIRTQLELFGRNRIDRVEYFVEDQFVFTTSEPPWTFSWGTHESGLAVDELYNLRVDVYNENSTDVASSRVFPVRILECSGRCLLIENNPTSLDIDVLLYGLIGLLFVVLLVILFVVLNLRRNNNNAVQSPPDFAPDFYRPAPPTIETAPGTSFDGGSTFPSGGGAPSPGQQTIFDSQVSGGSTFSAQQPQTLPVQPGFPPQGVGAGAGNPAKTVVLKRMPDKLAFLFNVATGKEYQINTPKSTIGRAPGNDIQLNDGSVSSFHAAIILEDGQFYVQDLGASNPTELNGVRVVREPLKNNDKLVFGREEFLFKNLDS